MSTLDILEAIDKQITQLQQARALLSGPGANTTVNIATVKPSGKRRGRPKGSVNKKLNTVPLAPTKTVRAAISAEGKARIAAAQKARWAALKKSSNVAEPTAKKSSAKQSKKTAMPAKKSVVAKRAPAVKSVASAKEA